MGPRSLLLAPTNLTNSALRGSSIWNALEFRAGDGADRGRARFCLDRISSVTGETRTVWITLNSKHTKDCMISQTAVILNHGVLRYCRSRSHTFAGHD